MFLSFDFERFSPKTAHVCIICRCQSFFTRIDYAIQCCQVPNQETNSNFRHVTYVNTIDPGIRYTVLKLNTYTSNYC